MADSRPIGFFDSGIGGLCVRDAVTALLPRENTSYIADSANNPYGTKTPAFIMARSRELTSTLLGQGCKAIVIACNTATAAAITYLRAEWPDIPFIGMEPAVKPAAIHTKTGVVAVLATLGTFYGRHYRETCARFAADVTVLACVADQFVQLVEHGETSGEVAEAIVREKLEPLLKAGADHIVLGCTHFPHLTPLISKVVAGRAEIIDPSPAVAAQVERVLRERDLLSDSTAAPVHQFIRTTQSIPDSFATQSAPQPPAE